MTHPSDPAADLLGIARALLDERRDRDLRLGDSMFADPAWELMLAVYIGQREGRPQAMLALEEDGRVPGSTTRRWIRLLVQRGLFESSRHRDEGMSVTLAPAMLARLEDHLGALAAALASVRGVG